MLTFFPPLPLAIWLILRAICKTFSNKSTLLTGPIASGKTTFLQYISKETIQNGPSGAPRRHKVKNAIFDEVTDFSGAEAWLQRTFDEHIREHDYIIFFFDVSEYVKDERYRDDVNARIDFIYKHRNETQKLLMVGTHIDKTCNNNYKSDVENFFAGKAYSRVLDHIVYVNTKKKECVKTILDELKKM